MTLYGYAREPDSTDADGEPSPVPRQPASAPLPAAGPTADDFGATTSGADPYPAVPGPAAPDLWAPETAADPDVPAPAPAGAPDPWAPPPPPAPSPPLPPFIVEVNRAAESPAAEPAPDPAGARPSPPSSPIGLPEPMPTARQAAMPPPDVRMSSGTNPTAGEPTELPVGPADHDWVASIAGLDDDDEIVPWDRRPLMVVIAGAVALLVLAVLSGVATVQIFGGDAPPAAWRGVAVPATGGPAEPTPAPGSGAGAPGTVTLSGVGDVIMGTEPADLPPNGGAGFFAPVKDALAADVVMGNLETPLTADTGRDKCPLATPSAVPGAPAPTPTRPEGCFQFFLPPTYANHLHDGGFTMMNLANNHTNDMGPGGLVNTRKALEGAGLQHTGASNQITYVDVKGVKVAVIGFAIYSWGQNLNNIPAAEQLVRKADAEADLVVIQMQGGAEGSDKTHVRPGKELYLGEDRGDLVKFSHAVIDAGADVVFGHGPHVMRGMEFYKGRLIAYSLGNFAGYGVLSGDGVLGIGGVLKVTLNKDGSWAGGQLVATEMVRGGLPVPDADKRALAFVGGLSRDDFAASAAAISTTDGTISPPAG